MKYPTIIVRSDVLSSWLTVSGYTRTQLAADLGVSKGRVSQLLSSPEEPSAHLMGKLLKLTGLSLERLFRIVQTESQLSSAYPNRAAQRPEFVETAVQGGVVSHGEAARGRK